MTHLAVLLTGVDAPSNGGVSMEYSAAGGPSECEPPNPLASPLAAVAPGNSGKLPMSTTRGLGSFRLKRGQLTTFDASDAPKRKARAKADLMMPMEQQELELKVMRRLLIWPGF